MIINVFVDPLLVDTFFKCKNILLNADSISYVNDQNMTSNTILLMPESFARIFIPVITTLFVFVLGQLINWYRSQKTIQNETNNFKNIILSWADLIRVPVENQVAALRELARKISISKDLLPESFFMNGMLADKVNSIDIERYISTLMINTQSTIDDNMNDKMTFNIVSQFNYLVLIEKKIEETYKAYQDETYKVMDEWNIEFVKLSKQLDDWIVKINSEHDYYEFKQRVLEISYHWKESSPEGRSSMINTIDNLIIPLSLLTTEELGRNIENEFAFQISETLQYLRVVDMKWKTNISAYSNVFNSMGQNISDSFDSLINAKKYFLENTKTKNVFQIGK